VTSKGHEGRPLGIIVLGSERSGTSVVTEMIHRWGTYAGPSDNLTPADEHNPHGRWEYAPLWQLLAEIGDFGEGATWWSDSFEERVTRKLQNHAIVAKARALMADMEREGTPWVWKDPALCHFPWFWKPIWGDVTYVITVRHPYDVARSWQRMAVPAERRDAVDLTACNLLRWQHMMLSVLRATEDTRRKIFVEYEQLVHTPLTQAGRLAQFLDEQTGWQRAEEVVEWMAAAVDPSLRRNRCDRPLAEILESTMAQQALYQLLQQKVSDPTAEFAVEFQMPEGWWQFVHEAEAVAHGRGDETARYPLVAATARRVGKTLIEELPRRVRRCWGGRL
jgi:hypothetical protein